MKNRLSDLNNHLFAQMERLSDESLDAEGLVREAQRSLAIVNVADKIIANAALQLKAVTVAVEHGEKAGRLLAPMLETPKIDASKPDAGRAQAVEQRAAEQKAMAS